ncbi:MAG: tRNA pseudouridine(55) synthase TruB [Cyclobacteriaceae bacterium]|nr:tRNA pseudouridine(55) synthase TruB [Cyclobacteriaceae bacterium]
MQESPKDPEKVLLVDKPLHWTSFDVVKKLRYHFKLKKIGHAGTLDPLASGLLILCTGKKTKEIESYMGLEKEYTGSFVIGHTTPSYDLETTIQNPKDITHITAQNISEVAKSFLGRQLQVPPIYSAVRVEGKRAYEAARKGKEVKLNPKEIEITKFEVEAILPEVKFRIVCSKGTYIRSIARDFGEKLGTGAYLAALRRTKIGDFSVEDAKSIEELTSHENL